MMRGRRHRPCAHAPTQLTAGPRWQGVYRTIEDGNRAIEDGKRGGVKPTRGKRARQVDEEEEHYWQSRKANRKEENGKQDRSVSKCRSRMSSSKGRCSPDTKFLSKCRSRMPKPMYLELLKCLNLYSQQIIDRSELLTLVHDLFKPLDLHDLFELFDLHDLFDLSNFRRLLGSSGGDARDAPSPPASRSAPEGGSFRDLDCCSLTTRSRTAGARELALGVPVVAPSVPIRLGPKFQVSTMPAYQGSCCTDAYERGDELQSLAEVEVALFETPTFLITAAGTSHRIRPDDYRQPKCSGRGPLEPLVLDFNSPLEPLVLDINSY